MAKSVNPSPSELEGEFFVEDGAQPKERKAPAMAGGDALQPRSFRLHPQEIGRLNAQVQRLRDEGVDVKQSELGRFLMVWALEQLERGEIDLPLEPAGKRLVW